MASWPRPASSGSQLGQPLVLNFWCGVSSAVVAAGGRAGQGRVKYLQGLDERTDHARTQIAHLAGGDVVAGSHGGDGRGRDRQEFRDRSTRQAVLPRDNTLTHSDANYSRT